MVGYWKKYIEVKCLEIQILSMWELLQLFAFHIYAGYTSIAEVCVHIKLSIENFILNCISFTYWLQR